MQILQCSDGSPNFLKYLALLFGSRVFLHTYLFTILSLTGLAVLYYGICSSFSCKFVASHLMPRTGGKPELGSSFINDFSVGLTLAVF
jgi:hypothetical protein